MLPDERIKYTDRLLSRSLSLLRVKFADRVQYVLIPKNYQCLGFFDHLLQFEDFWVRSCPEKTEDKADKGSCDTQVTT